MSTLAQRLKSGNRLWTFCFGGAALMIAAAINVPHLLREETTPKQFRNYQTETRSGDRDSLGGFHASLSPSTVAFAPAPPPPLAHAEDSSPARKIVQTSALEITVKNPVEVAEKIRLFAEGIGGYVESSQINTENAASANLVIRVPAAKLEEAKAALHKYAIRVESERTYAQDVTKQYVDMDARLRNLHAEEAQYLQIMKSAVKVQDMLGISEKLSDVRGEIEQQQAEFATLSKQIETVAITVSLRARAETDVLGFHWRPLYHLKVAAHDGLEGLANYVSSMATLALYLPVVLLWTATGLISALLGWRFLRWVADVLLGWKPATVPVE